jgi:hypothetical protein
MYRPVHPSGKECSKHIWPLVLMVVEDFLFLNGGYLMQRLSLLPMDSFFKKE